MSGCVWSCLEYGSVPTLVLVRVKQALCEIPDQHAVQHARTVREIYFFMSEIMRPVVRSSS